MIGCSQPAVALHIYREGRPCPLYKPKSIQILHKPRVRLRPDYTGLAGMTHRPSRCPWDLPNLVCNICPLPFGKAWRDKSIQKHQITTDAITRPSESTIIEWSAVSCILPYTRIISLQITTIQSSGQLLTSQGRKEIRIAKDHPRHLVRPFPTWRPLAELVVLHS